MSIFDQGDSHLKFNIKGSVSEHGFNDKIVNKKPSINKLQIPLNIHQIQERPGTTLNNV